MDSKRLKLAAENIIISMGFGEESGDTTLEEKMCTCPNDVVEKMDSLQGSNTCGDGVPSGAKRAVNQGISASEGCIGCVFPEMLR